MGVAEIVGIVIVLSNLIVCATWLLIKGRSDELLALIQTVGPIIASGAALVYARKAAKHTQPENPPRE